MKINESTLVVLKDFAWAWGGMLLKLVIIVSIGWVLSGWLVNRLLRGLEKTRIEPTILILLHSLLGVLFKVGVIVFALSQVGLKMTMIVAVLGGLSLSLGLALKQNISHVANGISLVVNKPFRVGDFIECGSISGTVESVGLFNTLLMTPSNQRIVTPNSQLANSTVTNFNADSLRRIELVLGLSYDDNMSDATTILKDYLASVDGVHAEKPVDVWLTDFGDSSINMSIRAWCQRSDFLAVRHRLIVAIQSCCEQNNYTIPYPQRDIHMLTSQVKASA